MEKENDKWYQIRDYDFEMNIKGKMRNRTTGIEPSISKTKGFLYYYPKVNGKKKIMSVHGTLAELFIPNPNNYGFVYHKDKKIN